jgi:osmotically-inducible protein OsmY
VQKIIILTVCLALTGCTSMLLGDGSSGDNSVTTSTSDASPSEDDLAISESISRAISAEPKLNEFALDVRTVDSNVIISGTVGSYTARDRVVEIASGFDGLSSVSYRIAVNTRL